MIRTFIVDDHKILSQAIADYLKSYPDIKCVGVAKTGTEALNKINDAEVDIVLMDISLPDMTGIECCSQLLKNYPGLSVMGLSTHQDMSIVKKLFKAGAKGYISKASNLEELHQGIITINKGEKYVGAVIKEAMLKEIQDDNLHQSRTTLLPTVTEREKEILDLIAQEYTTNEIAKALYISTNTVETHRRKLISKFGVRNSVGLIKKALELKMVITE